MMKPVACIYIQLNLIKNEKNLWKQRHNQNITLIVKKYTRYNFYHGGFPVYHSKRKASIMYDVSWCLLELLYIRQADCLQIQIKLTVYVYQTVNFMLRCEAGVWVNVWFIYLRYW